MATKILHQLELWSQLDGKIIMVTGASSGLEFCLDLAKAGCRVVAAARRADLLKSLCDQINASADGSNGGPCRAIAVELDVTADGPTIAASVEKAWGAFGHIDALINNAGVRGQVKSSLELSRGGMEQCGENKLDRVLVGFEISRGTAALWRPWWFDHQHLIDFRPKLSTASRRRRL